MNEVKAEASVPAETDHASIQTINNAVKNKLDDIVKSTSTEKPTALNIFAAIVNGAGVGLLLGMLLGLAISTVVSGVIGTLSGLLAVLLGINEQYLTVLKGIRVGAFGFFCVAGILCGMYVRINNGLLPSRTTMMQDYTKVGFSEDEARDFIAYREFNVVPAGWKSGATAGKPNVNKEVDGTVKPNAGNADSTNGKMQSAQTTLTSSTASAKAKQNTSSGQPAQNANARVFADANATGAERRSVLYSSEINGIDCRLLSLANETKPASEIKIIFQQAGGTWEDLEQNLNKNLPEKIYIHALLSLRDCLCAAAQNEKIQVTNSAAVSKLRSNDSLEKIKQTLSSSGEIWKAIVAKVSTEIPAENQKTLYLSLIKILGHA